jgi:phage baseplate assembly protein W
MSDFLGTGWHFPLSVDNQGCIAMVAEEARIRQAIWIILDTARGERVMRPDFGCGIHEWVFAVNNTATAGRVADAVRQALIRWEPRIDQIEVNATNNPEQPERLRVDIAYRVRTTNNRFNLTYPFYLEY